MKKAVALAHLRKLPAWTLAPNGKSIRREYRLKDFLAAVALIRRIAPLAQAMDHHPDLHLTGYRRLKIVLSTHDAGGLSLKDFRLATEIERLSKTRG